MAIERIPLIPPTDWISGALAGIGMATIATDLHGRVMSMSPVAETLTGWPDAEALGRPLEEVFRIENEATRKPVVDFAADVISSGLAVGLSDHTVLIGRHGRECRIDHGASPTRDPSGKVTGAAVVFCDVSERLRSIQAVEDARAFSEGIVQTVWEPLVVLDAELRVRMANHAFYRTFRLAPQETEGRSLFELGDRPWDIPGLRELLERVLPQNTHFNDFNVDHVFDGIGRRTMVLNARRLPSTGRRPELILLAIEDATDRVRAAHALAVSETRYRRLFETAQDGILLVDPDNRTIFDANPYLTGMLGYSRAELVGKELWEIGLFKDIHSNKQAFRILQANGYIRYDDLPLRTHDGRGIDVEFVSNVYDVGESRVIQCNIRDVTARKSAEDALRIAHADLEDRVTERTAELARMNDSLKNEITRRESAEAGRRDLQQKLTTVQEDERRRIARELHDELGQHLTAIGLGLKVVSDALPHQCPVGDRVQNLRAMTDVVGKEIHNLALELRPTALDDLGLQAALANYTEGWAARTGVETDFHSDGLGEDDRLPAPVETALYRVVQEALTNIIKHAAAKHVSVVLQRSAGQVSVVVEDDGKGFNAESVAKGRLGILGMRERTELVGGKLVVESNPDRGTTLIARIPLGGKEGGSSHG